MRTVPEFEPISALQELVRIDSQTDSIAEQQALDWASQTLHRMRIDYIKIPKKGIDGQYENGQHAAVAAKVKGVGSARVAFISDGHIDVVGVGNDWTRKQGEMEGLTMYGRGTTDMKIGVIAQIAALQEAASLSTTSDFDHWAIIVCGEETTSWGTEQAVDVCRTDWVSYNNLAAIIPEPTSYIDRNGSVKTKVMNGNMGCFSAEIVIKGDSGHAASSRGRINSIEISADVIHALRFLRSEWAERYAHSGLGLPVLSPTMINAGVASNSLPPESILRLDGRFPIELKDKYEEDLKKALKDFSEVIDTHILYYANPAFTPSFHPWVQANLQTFGQDRAELPLWTTDGCFFSGYKDGVHEGIPLVIAGPGFLDKLHIADELCDTSLIMPWVQSFLTASDSYARNLKLLG